MSIAVYNVRLIDADRDCEGMLILSQGRIHSVHEGSFDRSRAGSLASSLGFAEIDLFDGAGYALMPSFIDMHAHFRYPGQEEKESLDTALRAAAAGGFGTLVLMANTVPAISQHAAALSVMRDAAAFQLADVFQTISVTRGFDGRDLGSLAALPASGEADFLPVASEDGRDVASAAVLLEAFGICAQKGIIISCHSEDAALGAQAAVHRKRALELLKAGEGDRAEAELRAANRLLALAEDTASERNLRLGLAAQARVHLAHVSTAASAAAVRRAKAVNPALVSAEATPLHIALTAECSAGLRSIVNPPLRSEEDRLALIEALKDGSIDCIATDHAPHTRADKEAGAPGFPALETAFSVSYTSLVEGGHMGLSRLSELMSANPSRILGLDRGDCPRGRLKAGWKADVLLADTGAKRIIDTAAFFSKARISPFQGMELTGSIRTVFKEGRLVYEAT